jgi:hypothetical protein
MRSANAETYDDPPDRRSMVNRRHPVFAPDMFLPAAGPCLLLLFLIRVIKSITQLGSQTSLRPRGHSTHTTSQSRISSPERARLGASPRM